MYKLSTSEFGIDQQYVHVNELDRGSEVTTYDANGNALVYKEVDSSQGINRMVYPFLGANTSMELYVEHPGAYWINVGNKRFFATAGQDESDVQYKHTWTINEGTKKAIKLFDTSDSPDFNFYLKIKLYGVSDGQTIEYIEQVANFSIKTPYLFEKQISLNTNSPETISAVDKYTPIFVAANGSFYAGIPQSIQGQDMWFDIEASEVPNAIADGTHETNIDVPAGYTYNREAFKGDIFSNSTGEKYMIMPEGVILASNNEMTFIQNSLEARATSVNIIAKGFTFDTLTEHPYNAIKVKNSSHTTAENVMRVATSAPSTAPAFIGLFYIDSTAKNAYISVGTSSASDWKQITA